MCLKRFLPIILLVVANVLYAAPQQLYRVEIIVFAHITPAGLNSESWPAHPKLPSTLGLKNLTVDPVNAATANPTKAANHTATQMYQISTPDELDLTKVVQRLKQTSDYPPLVHVAWLQPGLPTKKAPDIHIYGGQAYDAGGKAINVTSPLLSFDQTKATAEAHEKSTSDDSAGNAKVSQWQVNGFVRISQPYLFQIDTDLALMIPHSEIEKIVPSVAEYIKANHFVMQQTFRLKLGKLYYIDHPLFGVLVIVTKYPKTTK